MNRVRRYEGKFQVLITPSLKLYPDNPLMVGNWEDESLRNYYILDFDTLNDAQCEAFKHPDIDWYRFTVSHQPIFQRLNKQINDVIKKFDYDVEIKSNLMDAEAFKNIMFDRVMRGGERFNLRQGFNDLISFTIVNPWTHVLHRIAKSVEDSRQWLYRDDLRIKEKRIVDGKIIVLHGLTEFGSIYEIKFVPTLIYQWGRWVDKNPHKTPEQANKVYQDILKSQE